jgi:peroxidase
LLYCSFKIFLLAGLTNEFSTAAFRVGHSMVLGQFDRLQGNFSSMKSVNIRDTYFMSHSFYEPGAVDELIRGLTEQPGKMVENSVSADLTQQLFPAFPSPGYGLDLISLNIQRGRDHGLPGYLKWRELCGLPTAQNFNDLKKLKILPDKVVDKMNLIYE